MATGMSMARWRCVLEEVGYKMNRRSPKGGIRRTPSVLTHLHNYMISKCSIIHNLIFALSLLCLFTVPHTTSIP